MATQDQDSDERIVLLVKKYAQEGVTLTKEEAARLEVLHQKMDILYPRYSQKEWDTLDEAQQVAEKLNSYLESNT